MRFFKVDSPGQLPTSNKTVLSIPFCRVPILCYLLSVRPEDRATLGSDPSAEAGGYKVGPCEEHGLPLYSRQPEAQKSDKPNYGLAQYTSLGVLYPIGNELLTLSHDIGVLFHRRALF
jgi:hypothetical protein